MSHEYISLSTLEQKMRFWRFIGQYVRKTAPPLFLPFLAISYGCEGIYDFYESIHHHPWAGVGLSNVYQIKLVQKLLLQIYLVLAHLHVLHNFFLVPAPAIFYWLISGWRWLYVPAVHRETYAYTLH